MIPATSFLLDGDTALLVLEYPQPVDAPTTVQWRYELNRPCDTCDGDGTLISIGTASEMYLGRLIPANERVPCPDCDGIGRWTFDIDIDHDPYDGYFDTLRVHVIDVLPIVHDHECDTVDHDIGLRSDGSWDEVWPDGSWKEITLPPDAAPGKWLVRLKVHQ